jgi:phytoene/squalene synthetase
MKQLFDRASYQCSKVVTKKYSTSFSLAVKMLSPKIREAIYSIYGFVRLADEIVDTFHAYDKKFLLNRFESDYYRAMKDGISLNPILNSFVLTVKKYQITDDLIKQFLNSMRSDLNNTSFHTQEEYNTYIHGSADVVGLMCLKVFVDGDQEKYEHLKPSAMRLGSAFQKVNFLRDIKDDYELLNRSYFPGLNLQNLDEGAKEQILEEIEADFREAYKGIRELPLEAKFGVYTAYIYYRRLLKKIRRTPSEAIVNNRIRISNSLKLSLLARSFVVFKLNLI